jgi:hypothetical protein
MTFPSFLSLACGAISVCLCISWINHNFEGFLHIGSNVENPISHHGFFNWHIILGLSSICLAFLPAILTFQVFNSTETTRRWLTVTGKRNLHAIFAGLALLAMAGAITIASVEHRHEHGVNFVSIHSWLGLAFGGLFLVQWLVGISALHVFRHKLTSSIWLGRILKTAERTPLESLKNLHRAAGILFLGLSAAIIASGIVEKQQTVMKSKAMGSIENRLAVVRVGNVIAMFALVGLLAAGLKLTQFSNLQMKKSELEKETAIVEG